RVRLLVRVPCGGGAPAFDAAGFRPVAVCVVGAGLGVHADLKEAGVALFTDLVGRPAGRACLERGEPECAAGLLPVVAVHDGVGGFVGQVGVFAAGQAYGFPALEHGQCVRSEPDLHLPQGRFDQVGQLLDGVAVVSD